MSSLALGLIEHSDFRIPLVFLGRITNPSNTVAVATLIEEIKLDLKDQTGSWRKVSERLN